MDGLMVAAGALAFSLLGAGLLRVARQAVEPLEETPKGLRRLFSQKAALAGMMLADLALAAMLYGFYGQGPFVILRTLLMCSILWPCAWADLQAFLIPNKVLLTGGIVAAGLLGLEVLLQPGQAVFVLSNAAIAAAALLAVSLLCRLISPKAVGMGDVKLLGVMGFCLGMDLVWTALFVSFLMVFVGCVFLLATKRAKRTDSIPFAPFLLLGTLAAAFLTGI